MFQSCVEPTRPGLSGLLDWLLGLVHLSVLQTNAKWAASNFILLLAFGAIARRVEPSQKNELRHSAQVQCEEKHRRLQLNWIHLMGLLGISTGKRTGGLAIKGENICMFWYEIKMKDHHFSFRTKGYGRSRLPFWREAAASVCNAASKQHKHTFHQCRM